MSKKDSLLERIDDRLNDLEQAKNYYETTAYDFTIKAYEDIRTTIILYLQELKKAVQEVTCCPSCREDVLTQIKLILGEKK